MPDRRQRDVDDGRVDDVQKLYGAQEQQREPAPGRREEGNLSSELGKDEDGLEHYAALSVNLIIAWAEAQFRELGRSDARDLAVTLLAGVQGAALLPNVFRDPLIVTREVSRLGHWIDSLT